MIYFTITEQQENIIDKIDTFKKGLEILEIEEKEFKSIFISDNKISFEFKCIDEDDLLCIIYFETEYIPTKTINELKMQIGKWKYLV